MAAPEPRPVDQILEQLHVTLAQELLNRIKSGEASAAELTAAAKFLKDNGIDGIAKNESPLLELAKSLPFADPEEIVKKSG